VCILVSYCCCFFCFCSRETYSWFKRPITPVDSIYREDQFYVGVLPIIPSKNKPVDIAQQKNRWVWLRFFCVICPVKKSGYCYGVGFTLNITIKKSNNIKRQKQLTTQLITMGGIWKNKFTQLLVEVPLEFSWRSSTFESYKFWRIYGGVKFSYLFMINRYLKQQEPKQSSLTIQTLMIFYTAFIVRRI
jgi:hypothetical protein